jgi:disulfide oxidoreductase YuzD
MALVIESQNQRALKPFADLAKHMGFKVKYTKITVNNRQKTKSEFEEKIENELLNYRNAKREKIFQKSAVVF